MTDAPTRSDPFAGLPPIFRECVDPHLGKSKGKDISTPWRCGDHVYATDARMVVRIPACLAPGVPVRTDVPDAPSIYSTGQSWYTEPIVLPDVGEGTMPCPACKGDGKTFRDPYGCEDCDGEGTVWVFDPVEVAPGLKLSTVFIGRLRRHGILTVRAACDPYFPKPPDWGNAPWPVRFDLGYVVGFLMPMT